MLDDEQDFEKRESQGSRADDSLFMAVLLIVGFYVVCAAWEVFHA